MTTAVRVHKIASVVYRLGLTKDLEITTRLEPRAGNAVVVRALNEKRVYSELELENGRMSKIFRGDLIVGALGRRRALKGFAGDVPENLRPGDTVALLNRGGVIGTAFGGHKDLGLPLACEVLGMVVRGGRILNIADAALPAPESIGGLGLPPVVLVSGTAMESGKTLFLSELIQELSKRGVRVAGGKLTGVACLRDLISMEDHGAVATASFLDAGYPSTAELPSADLLRIARAVLGELARSQPDCIVLELGDGILGDYGVLELLRSPEIEGAVALHVFCATDLVGAWGGKKLLEEHGIEIDLFSGPVTDNEVGVRFLERELHTPAINAYREPERVAAEVARRIGLPLEAAPDSSPAEVADPRD